MVGAAIAGGVAQAKAFGHAGFLAGQLQALDVQGIPPGLGAPAGGIEPPGGKAYPFSEQVADTGRLYLLYWDSYYQDNTDYVTAMVTADINIDAIPEPATLVLLGIGLVGLLGVRRKFKK